MAEQTDGDGLRGDLERDQAVFTLPAPGPRSS